MLLAQAESALRLELQAVLEGGRFTVDAVGAITDARNALAYRNFDIVCMDASLSDIQGDGLDLARDLRSRSGETPIIVTAPNDCENRRRRTDEIGASIFPPNPFSLIQFHRLANDLIRDYSTKTLRLISGLALAALTNLFILHLPVHAVAQERIACGSVYRVAPGDTLNRIAVRAYGTGDYQAIVEANRDILTNLAHIDIGDELLIPCLDGTRPRTRAEDLARASGTAADSADPAPTATASVIMPDDVGIAFLTGSDFAPFVHPALPEGGMITELVRLAMSRAAPERTIKIALVKDWSAHLDLLEDGTFDLGFPWYRPDCSKADKLGASMRRRCAEFDFSDPLFEVAIGYYVRAGDPLADVEGYDQLSGRRICRPANYFTFDLEQEGLVAPNATLIIAPAVSDCFIWLEQGKVDVVTLSKLLAVNEITRHGLDGRVAEIPALASVQTLHAVAPKNHPDGRAYLDLVNAGLTELQASGRWFEVVSRHFGAFAVSIR